MSKQDGCSPRTAVDLERKYNFNETFAEVYGLAHDAQTAADEAKKAAESSAVKLSQEEIFNLLTDNGKAQGLFMGDDGNIYFNASYINGGTVKAEYLDVENLKVKAANIEGTVTAKQIDATELKVDGANVTDEINAASFVSKGTEEYQETKIQGGKIAFKSGCLYDGQSGVLYFDADTLRFDAGIVDFILSVDTEDPSNTRILRISPEYGLATVDGNGEMKQYAVFSKAFVDLRARVDAIEARLGM